MNTYIMAVTFKRTRPPIPQLIVDGKDGRTEPGEETTIIYTTLWTAIAETSDQAEELIGLIVMPGDEVISIGTLEAGELFAADRRLDRP